VLISMGGIVLAAAYMLWMLQRVVLGEASTEAAKVLPDMSNRELATLIPLAILVLGIGLYPGPLMEMMDASVINLIQQVK
ncbi:MAG: NADH-quinone oxidoreductase subunit M, partial [Nitrospinae bacterium]|nr:NADH-quinone oxidoreductase subunit M [Nitrospinota bacterium]